MKTFQRFPPERNPKIIDVPLLCSLMKKFARRNSVSLTPDGLNINGTEFTFKEGFASSEKLKFRFRDVFDLLHNLKGEKILSCRMEDLYSIKIEYHKIMIKR
ncbi:MAG TPA: hypothetical protein DCX95_01135 [Elusimicrobia bacterium]|nr:hypothetical protein [Elusimicrobiota bacterium]